MSREVMRLCEKCRQWSWIRGRKIKCPKCGENMMAIRMTRGEGLQVIPDMKEYLSENMGHEPVPISGRAQWREELKRRELICVG